MCLFFSVQSLEQLLRVGRAAVDQRCRAPPEVPNCGTLWKNCVGPPIRTPFPICFRAPIFQSLEIEVKIYALNLFIFLAAVFRMP